MSESKQNREHPRKFAGLQSYDPNAKLYSFADLGRILTTVLKIVELNAQIASGAWQ